MSCLPVWSSACLAFATGVTLSLMLRSIYTGARTPQRTRTAAGPEQTEAGSDAATPADGHLVTSDKAPLQDGVPEPTLAGESIAPVHEAASIHCVTPRICPQSIRAERGALSGDIRAAATVTFDESLSSFIHAPRNGIVLRIVERPSYATVVQGQTLLILISPEWTAAQEEYLALRRSNTSHTFEQEDAARRHLGTLGMSEAEILQIDQTDKAQTRFAVVSTRSGIVTELSVREGDAVTAGAILACVNGIETLWMLASVIGAQRGRVAPGSPVEIRFPALPLTTLTGTIDDDWTTGESTPGAATVRVIVDNRARCVMPGVSGEVLITPTHLTGVVLVPTEAVITTPERRLVVIGEAQCTFVAREVRVGDVDGEFSEILSGVEEGERVVLPGKFRIDSEGSLASWLDRLGRNVARADA